MRDIQKEIQENLDAIGEKHNVRILMAVESGSRAWGFASPDSDYDVRFIYVRPEEEYLRVDPTPDVIEWQLDEILDINGWDLKKAMLAFAKGNPSVMEWANSGVIYRNSETWEQIKETVFTYFSEKAALCHYYGLARNTLESHLRGETVRYKKYFYALRPLLCCKWIERYHEAPPMAFQVLLTMFDGTDPDLSAELLEQILILLELKAVSDEKEMHPQMPLIRDFIFAECERQKAISSSLHDDHKRDYSAINQAFRFAVRSSAA